MKNKTPIENPYENEFCYKCLHCFDDMCSVIKLGDSFAYCPQVKLCYAYSIYVDKKGH